MNFYISIHNSLDLLYNYVSIADDSYHACGSLYHTLRTNVPVLADWFTTCVKKA